MNPIDAMAPAANQTSPIAAAPIALAHDQPVLASAIVEHLAGGIIAADTTGRIVLYNAAAAHIFGPVVHGTSIETWAQGHTLYLPDLANPVRPRDLPLMCVLRGEAITGVEMVLRDAQHDQERWLNVIGWPVHDAQGILTHGVIVCQDITERKQAERAAQLVQERFAMLIARMPVGIFRTDAQGDCVFVNERLLAMSGLTSEEAMGPGWARSLHPDDREAIFAGWYRAAQEGIEFTMEYRLQRPDGTITWVHGRSVALYDATGAIEGYLGTTTDITARKHVEEESQRLHKTLIQLQEAALAELSTPLIPINDHVMVMPLIGTIDSRRSRDVMRALLDGIERSRANVAILDITGVALVDTQVANGLVQAAQAVRMLGAEIVLTGIRPEVAQTLLGIGADLTSLHTRRSLQEGIAFALRKLRVKN